MTRTLRCIVLLLLCLVSWPFASAATAQETVFLVRHAERLDDTTDPPLSSEGTARAQRLADTLRDAGITAVFSTQFRRTVDTGRPLADRLGLAVVPVTAGQHGELIRQIRALGPKARVLVVGHSDTVPELLTAFGHPNTIAIAKPEYDNLFVIVPGTGPQPTVLRLRY
jgi:broad specificity phosphatase PhoE